MSRLIALFACVAVHTALPAADNPQFINVEKVLANLAKQEDSSAITKKFIEERNDLLEKLITLVTDDTRSEEERIGAAKLLGAMRSERAVSSLIQMFDFGPSVRPNNIFSELRPCANALISIGTPSVKPLLESLSKEQNEQKRIRIVYVIREIEGSEVIRFILQRRVELAEDVMKEHWKACLRSLDKLDEKK
jgi:HEAT repeat protein